MKLVSKTAVIPEVNVNLCYVVYSVPSPCLYSTTRLPVPPRNNDDGARTVGFARTARTQQFSITSNYRRFAVA